MSDIETRLRESIRKAMDTAWSCPYCHSSAWRYDVEPDCPTRYCMDCGEEVNAGDAAYPKTQEEMERFWSTQNDTNQRIKNEELVKQSETIRRLEGELSDARATVHDYRTWVGESDVSVIEQTKKVVAKITAERDAALARAEQAEATNVEMREVIGGVAKILGKEGMIRAEQDLNHFLASSPGTAILERVKRYEGALRWYADRENYSDMHVPMRMYNNGAGDEAEYDDGNIAREALAGGKDG